ncbi:hypothetical protein F2Q70_00011413 [Brassica cretica]|uniref:DUF1985 domain-containing protein n=2 Tax=Brassica cretica TaxID=69181 RepID=A0A8S9LWI5_BRACR|nr:hypothetical protein F2Q70_00011413 [Brassica cretica]
MDQLDNGDDEDLDKPADEDVLALSKGPITRSRSRKLTQAIGGLVKMSWKQEECLGFALLDPIVIDSYSRFDLLLNLIDRVIYFKLPTTIRSTCVSSKYDQRTYPDLVTIVPMGKESEEEAELVRKNKMLREQMTEQMNQTMITTMADMLKASMKEFREEMRQEFRQAAGQGHSNESRRNRPTPIRQEHAGSQETDNYYSRHRTEHNQTERNCVSSPLKSTVTSPVKLSISSTGTPSSLSDIAATKDMESKQPIILYREGFEPQVKKINNCCRMELLRILKEAMSEEYGEVKRDPVFTHIMDLQSNRLKLSWKLVHSHLCKELITSKRFVFTRTPLRFSLQKYPDVTGLKISRESSSDVVKWKDDGGFWSKLLKVGGKITLKSIRKVHLQKVHNWTRLDRLRLIYLCVIMGMVMGKDEKVNIPHMYIKLVMDLDKVWKFHWGFHSFDILLRSIEKTRKNLSNKESYIFKGFTYAFQIWIIEAVLIPFLLSLALAKLSQAP